MDPIIQQINRTNDEDREPQDMYGIILSDIVEDFIRPIEFEIFPPPTIQDVEILLKIPSNKINKPEIKIKQYLCSRGMDC